MHFRLTLSFWLDRLSFWLSHRLIGIHVILFSLDCFSICCISRSKILNFILLMQVCAGCEFGEGRGCSNAQKVAARGTWSCRYTSNWSPTCAGINSIILLWFLLLAHSVDTFSSNSINLVQKIEIVNFYGCQVRLCWFFIWLVSVSWIIHRYFIRLLPAIW